MDYSVEITETAKDRLKKFDQGMQKLFFKRIEKLKYYPKIHGKPLRRPLQGKWEIRFERRWRIVYEIDDKENLIKIVAIWHKDEF